MSEWRLDSLGEELEREPGYDDKAPAPRPRRRPWRRLILGLLVVAVAGLGVFVWQAYQGFRHTAETGIAPLIRADGNPIRMRPEQPGGMEVPHQDRLVLQEMTAANGRSAAEQLPPPPEEPIARLGTAATPGATDSPPASAVSAAAPTSADAAATAPANPAERRAEPLISRASPAPASEPAAASSQTAALPESETNPDLIARVLLSEEGEGLVAAAPAEAGHAASAPADAPVNLLARPGSGSAPQAQPGSGRPAGAPPSAAPGEVASAAPARPVPAAPVTPPAPAAHRPSPPPATAAAAAPAAASAAPAVRPTPGGSARVQLAAVPSAEKAREEWGRLVQRNRAELGQLQMSTQSVEVNGQTLYRVMAGPLDESGARALCTQLKARGINCIVRP